jgi:hypothetical protein
VLIFGGQLWVLLGLSLNFAAAFVHLFIAPFIFIGQLQRAIACDTRLIEHVRLVSLKAFAFACITNIQLIVCAQNVLVLCDSFFALCLGLFYELHELRAAILVLSFTFCLAAASSLEWECC